MLRAASRPGGIPLMIAAVLAIELGGGRRR